MTLRQYAESVGWGIVGGAFVLALGIAGLLQLKREKCRDPS